MAFKGISSDAFKATMARYLTPSQAITSPEHLKGRTLALSQIARAFNSPGRHIFIHGDRGIGKTSLAQTAAAIHQSADAEPVLVSCGGEQSFLAIVRDAVSVAVQRKSVDPKVKAEYKIRFGFPGAGVESSISSATPVVSLPTSVNDASNLLRMVRRFYSREPVFIFDEFDQLTSASEQKVCADLLKHISDEKIGIRCIVCGIGSSLDGLIGVHMSSGRYLAPIKLERLPHEALWEIVQTASTALNISVAYPHLLRIGQISDGFPFYVHLIAEQMLWNAFEDETEVSSPRQEHFAEGIRQAVGQAEPMLQAAYERATKKYKHSDDYEEVLWALADAHLLTKQTTDVYEKSYTRIMSERPNRTKLSKVQFSGRLNALKTGRHGKIVTGTGAGWYEFRENVVRGYVRLRAEGEGVTIGAEGYG